MRELLLIEPDARRGTFLNLLRSARRSIHLSLFRCDDTEIVDTLVEMQQGGIDVRVLMTNRAKRSMKHLEALFCAFKRDGIRVLRYFGEHERYHAKYTLVDDNTAAVSSMNLTRERFWETDDFLLVTSDRRVVTGLRELFHSDWSGMPCRFPLPSARLVVSPDTARERVSALISGATRSILIADHKLSDPSVRRLLEDARQRGVDVQLIADRQRHGRRAHGKAMVIDERLAIAGSLALSADTLDRRRDLAVIIDTPWMVRQLLHHLGGAKERQCA